MTPRIPRWRRWYAVFSVAALFLVALPTVVGASGRLAAVSARFESSAPVERCRVTDRRLRELSGLVGDGERMYVVADGGDRLRVSVLRPDCSTERVITNQVDPFDVEDLARDRDGTLWLADIGDNQHRRDSVALHAVDKAGRATLYRMSYPDGPHDAEALLLDANRRPYIVTKEPFGAARVYSPNTALSATSITPLAQVGTVTIDRTTTPGGPERAGGFASVLITGGAVSANGQVIALRTYTDAYLFSCPNGDIGAGLKSTPKRVALPNEPQGEAIAFEPDGTLLSAGEEFAPISAITDAMVLAPPVTVAPSSGDNTAGQAKSAPDGPEAVVREIPAWQSLGLAGVAGLIVLIVLRGVRRLRR